MKLVSRAGFYAAQPFREAVHAAMEVEICNRCSDIELVDPLYFSDGAVCCKPLKQKVAPGDTLATAFKINFGRTDFEGALMCRLRKRTNNDKKFSTDTINTDEKLSSHIRFIVGWKLVNPQGPRIYMLLIEHGENLVWNENKLAEKHNEFRGRLSVHSSAVTDIWSMEDGSVLRLASDGVENRE
jgi:hypothetical protein